MHCTSFIYAVVVRVLGCSRVYRTRKRAHVRVINTLVLRLRRCLDPLASLVASVSSIFSMHLDPLWWVLTMSSCCWEPDRNPTWWNIVEDVRVPSVPPDRPRLYPLRQICVSLFDVSVKKSVRHQWQNTRTQHSLFVQAFISLLKLLYAKFTLPSSTSR